MGELQTLGPEPVPDVIEILEDTLARAKAGEVIGVAIAASCHGRPTATVYHIGGGTISDLYLAIERIKLRLLEHGG